MKSLKCLALAGLFAAALPTAALADQIRTSANQIPTEGPQTQTENFNVSVKVLPGCSVLRNFFTSENIVLPNYDAFTLGTSNAGGGSAKNAEGNVSVYPVTPNSYARWDFNCTKGTNVTVSLAGQNDSAAVAQGAGYSHAMLRAGGSAANPTDLFLYNLYNDAAGLYNNGTSNNAISFTTPSDNGGGIAQSPYETNHINVIPQWAANQDITIGNYTDQETLTFTYAPAV
jgi:hypothetical protein